MIPLININNKDTTTLQYTDTSGFIGNDAIPVAPNDNLEHYHLLPVNQTTQCILRLPSLYRPYYCKARIIFDERTTPTTPALLYYDVNIVNGIGYQKKIDDSYFYEIGKANAKILDSNNNDLFSLWPVENTIRRNIPTIFINKYDESVDEKYFRELECLLNSNVDEHLRKINISGRDTSKITYKFAIDDEHDVNTRNDEIEVTFPTIEYTVSDVYNSDITAYCPNGKYENSRYIEVSKSDKPWRKITITNVDGTHTDGVRYFLVNKYFIEHMINNPLYTSYKEYVNVAPSLKQYSENDVYYGIRDSISQRIYRRDVLLQSFFLGGEQTGGPTEYHPENCKLMRIVEITDDIINFNGEDITYSACTSYSEWTVDEETKKEIYENNMNLIYFRDLESCRNLIEFYIIAVYDEFTRLDGKINEVSNFKDEAYFNFSVLGPHTDFTTITKIYKNQYV